MPITDMNEVLSLEAHFELLNRAHRLAKRARVPFTRAYNHVASKFLGEQDTPILRRNFWPSDVQDISKAELHRGEDG